jgi:BirA family biotin operon repressor/biotin-[acetyl-CoA-carboxylase] ligase
VIRSQPILPAGYRLVCYDSLGSTNDEAKRLAREGATDGTIVWAREQTAGRGRRGRVWVSPRGNLHASLILRPQCSASGAAQLGFVAALAIGGALCRMLPRLRGLSYKWPNDVLVNGRKIAGILLESEATTPEGLAFLIIGVGVNLSTSPSDTDYPATSVAEECAVGVTPEAMLAEFVDHFQLWEKRWREEGFAPVRAAWRAAAASPGEPIRVRLETNVLHGRFLDIDEQGALLLETAGQHRRISAGEIVRPDR